jgi:hypothetical protein
MEFSPLIKGYNWVPPFNKGYNWVFPFTKGYNWILPFRKGEPEEIAYEFSAQLRYYIEIPILRTFTIYNRTYGSVKHKRIHNVSFFGVCKSLTR